VCDKLIYCSTGPLVLVQYLVKESERVTATWWLLNRDICTTRC